MRKFLLTILGAAGLTASALAAPPATQPAVSEGDIELRANTAFNRGEYAIALPLLQKEAAALKDQPDRLGPVNEQIKVAKTAIAKANLQQNVVAVSTYPAAAADQRKPHDAPKPGVVQEMTIKELGNFDYDTDKGGNIPEDVKKLSGSTIRLRGFMIPMNQAERITKFALVPSLFACCFGQPPQIQHTIIVDCPAGKGISYFPDEISVEGKLTVEEKKEDDIIISIFEVQTSSVKPAPK